MSHSSINPAILYWGTPVVLITTTNEDGTSNIGPMSSAFWLGDRCMLGLENSSQTTKNLRRTKQCVLNLPTDDMTEQVNALAKTTGTQDVPDGKKMRGYRYEKDKFGVSKLTPQPSELIQPHRIRECSAQMEAEMNGEYEINVDMSGSTVTFAFVIEVRILKTYVSDHLRLPGHKNRIDSDAWKPMIMSFQNLYGLRGSKQVESTLATIDEELYRLPEE